MSARDESSKCACVEGNLLLSKFQDQRSTPGGGGTPQQGPAGSPWPASGSYGSKPSTPGPQTPQPSSHPAASSPLPSQPQQNQPPGGAGVSQQQGQGAQQVFRQGSQSLGGAMSPRTPYSNPEPLQKQGSISSLRDALIANTPTATAPAQQQYVSYNSPRLSSDHQPSPVAPQTPDAHTPVGGGSTGAGGGGNAVMSPTLAGVVAHQDSLGGGANDPELMRTFSQQNSEMAPSKGGTEASQNNTSNRVSPFQVESILGIKNNKPIEPVSPIVGLQPSPVALQHQGSFAESVNSLRDGSTGLQSPHAPLYGPGIMNSQDGGGQNAAPGRPDSLGFYGRGAMETRSSPSLLEGKVCVKKCVCMYCTCMQTFYCHLFTR